MSKGPLARGYFSGSGPIAMGYFTASGGIIFASYAEFIFPVSSVLLFHFWTAIGDFNVILINWAGAFSYLSDIK